MTAEQKTELFIFFNENHNLILIDSELENIVNEVLRVMKNRFVLTKIEAMKLLQQGKKITHRNFAKDEYIKQCDGQYYFDEDGLMLNRLDFWKYRTEKIWESGWGIFEDIENDK